jgi:hypothetical protein
MKGREGKTRVAPSTSITIVSDTPNCGIKYDHHYDDCNSFIIQATELALVFTKCLKIILKRGGLIYKKLSYLDN